MSELDVVVTFSDSSKRSRLVGVPTDEIESGDYEGDDIWDGRTGVGTGGALAPSDPAGADGEWSSGEPMEFRIKTTGTGVDVQPGEKVFVKVVHEPSGNVLIDRTLVGSTGSLAPADALALVAPSTSGAASWPSIGSRAAASG